MEMNLGILFCSSLPEACLNLAIMLILGEQKKCFFIKKTNVARFITAIMLMLISTWFIRPMVSNVAVSCLAHSCAYTLILIIVYRVQIIQALYSVSALYFFFAAFENIYYPYVIAYVYGGMDNYQNLAINFVICAIPIRILQIGLIVLLWKNVDALAATKLNMKFYKIFVASFFVLAYVEYFLSNYFVEYFDKMALADQILFSVALFTVMVTFNVLIYSFINLTIKGIITQGYRHYQNLETSMNNAFSEAYRLLIKNDIEGAKKLVISYANVQEEKEMEVKL